MVVDDNDDICEAMTMALEIRAYEVLTISNGEKILKESKLFSLDVILLDLYLGTTSRYPVNYQKWGADGAIEKPFDINDLINQIKFAVLNRKELLTKSK